MRKRSRNLLLFSWFEKKKHVETEKEPPKVYSALEVARHIINYVNSNDQLLSNLKLQKLLYFVQAEFLISQERICFTDDIEAWDFGPVVSSVFREFKIFGSFHIPPVKHYYVEDESQPFNFRRVVFYDIEITDEDKAVINEVVDYFADYSSATLTDLTLKQFPWKNAYSDSCRNVITEESIRNYFLSRE